VPGLGQRPIPAGSTFTYKWRADTYGSYFYHAHSRGQIDDGAYGPIIVRPTIDNPKPFDKIDGATYDELWAAEQNTQPVLLSDWRHKTSEETWTDQLASGVETAICMDSVLVNGKGAVECLSRDVLDAFQDPAIAHIMKPNNLTLTNKGYGSIV
jgi:FtsP/CotA-like multicopper oxidase with cupredoxin domain